MEFDINRVYTAVNADEVKVGSKVICANTIKDLKRKVAENEITEIKGIKDDCYENRFSAWFDDDLLGYALAYLISEPDEKKLKWTDLKIGDVIRRKGEIRMITGISTVRDSSEMHIFNGTNWLTDEELAEWEKVEENRSVEE